MFFKRKLIIAAFLLLGNITFYRLWLSGKNKREAFTEAQKQIREKYENPYFWAAFVMMD
jgi:CHAT domain-containing protein